MIAAILPFLRQQKGDAASEARRRGFIQRKRDTQSLPLMSKGEWKGV